MRLFLDLIGSKWVLCVLYELINSTKRYSEINKAIDGIRQKSLSATLRKMERNGMIERIIYPVIPPRVEYQLTALGIEIVDISTKLGEWVSVHSDNITNAQNLYDSTLGHPSFLRQSRNPNTPTDL